MGRRAANHPLSAAAALRGDGALRDRHLPGPRSLRHPGRAAPARRRDLGDPDRRPASRSSRRTVPGRCSWSLVATCAEVLGSIVLGAYTYRLENLPAFVPPGHGLVFLAGLRISQSEPVRRHPRAFIWAVIAHRGRLGSGRAGAARPDGRSRGDHRRASDLRPAPRPRGDPVRGRLPDGRLPGDLRHLDRGLALGRDHARHAAARRQPPKRDRGRLRALRRRCDRACSARARCTEQGAGAPAAGTAGRHTPESAASRDQFP